jgi:hypothetical protein
MPLQDTIINATGNLSGCAAAVVIAIVMLLVFAPGAESLFQPFDGGLPWRQLVIGRSLNALTLSLRCLHAIVGSYLAATLRSCSPVDAP